MIFYLAAINEGKKAMVISALRGLVFVYPAVGLMSRSFGLTGAWLAMTVVEMLTLIGIAMIVWNKRGKRVV